MLVELQIENFALIDSVQLEFREGLNVLTGETGAGKSIVLDALGFLLGDPARDVVHKRARVTGRFMLSPEAKKWLVEQGWDEEDEAIALREVSPGGRARPGTPRCGTSARMRTETESVPTFHEMSAPSPMRPSSCRRRSSARRCAAPVAAGSVWSTVREATCRAAS